MTLIRALRTAKVTLTRTFYLDEAATDAAGAVTVTVKRLDGTTVQTGPASGPDLVTHAYTFTFDGRDVLDELVVLWTLTIDGDAVVLDQDRIQVVGGFFFTLAEGRSWDNALANVSMYPTERLAAARIEVEDEAERLCGQQSFVPRFARVVVSGTGTSTLYVGKPHLRAVRSIVETPPGGTPSTWDPATVAGVSLSPQGILTRWLGVWPLGPQNLTIELEHGLDYPPSEISRVSKIRLKSLMLSPKSGLPDRSVQIPGGGGQVQQQQVPLATANADKTGLPDVDAVYQGQPIPTPGFG